MGGFYEPQGGVTSPPKVFTQTFFEDVVKRAIDSGEVAPDAKLVMVAAANETGVKAVVALTVKNDERLKVKVNGIFEHDWDGDTKAGAKVILSMR